MRKLIAGGSSYEEAWGYSRAVVEGDWVFVSGTTGFDYATMAISDDPAEQTRQCFSTIAQSLAQAGCSLTDIVRIRYYVPDPNDWPSIGMVCGDVLRDVRPAATAIVCGLVDPRMRIEIEVTAHRQTIELL